MRLQQISGMESACDDPQMMFVVVASLSKKLYLHCSANPAVGYLALAGER